MHVEPLDDRTAAVIGAWRYPGRFSTYNVTQPLGRELAVVVRDDDGELLGYGVLGADARVDGLDEAEDTVDVGWGMAPHRMNHGLGRAFAAALTQHANNYALEQGRALLRAVILDWNEASLRVAGAVGFEPSGELTSLDGRFIVLTQPAGALVAGRPAAEVVNGAVVLDASAASADRTSSVAGGHADPLVVAQEAPKGPAR